MPTFEYKADAATPCLTLIPAPVTLEYTHGTAMIGSLVTIEKRIPEYAVTEDAAEKARDAGVGAGAGAGAPAAMNGTVILLCVDARLAHDEYTLDVFASDTIAVRGGSESGLRYGMQTLRQMIRQTSRTLPCLHIQDKPAFAVRAYSLDVTRGRVPTMAFLTWFIDQLALYKYNQFQLYVEHAFAFGELSEAWRGTDPLTADDIMFLDEYCAHHGIELVPSLATFGHMYMNLRTREHRGLGEFPEDARGPSILVAMRLSTWAVAGPYRTRRAPVAMSCMPISSKTYAARLPIVVYNRCCGRISRSRIRTPWTCCPATSRCSTGCMSRISTKARSRPSHHKAAANSCALPCVRGAGSSPTMTVPG